ncbi:MAG: DUF5694 domain-containing protein [Lewinella sp.]
MKNLIAAISLLILSCGYNPTICFAQTAQNPLEVNPIKVYLLGTFHFAQTDSTYDVFEEKHQKSIEALSDIIVATKAEKVFIERQPEFEFQNKMDLRYAAYLRTDTLRYRNEIWQVGFRAAKKAGHKKIYQCDNPGRYGSLFQGVKDYAEENGQLGFLEGTAKGAVARFDELVNEDSIMQNSTLLEYLQWINSPKRMKTSHGSYLANFPQIGSTDFYNYDEEDTLIGAKLTADWYRRNIMIYAKMINQLDYSEEAIFLLMGADHIPIIKSLFEGNPYFEVVDVERWLK